MSTFLGSMTKEDFSQNKAPRTGAALFGWVPGCRQDVLRSARPKDGVEIAACRPEGDTWTGVVNKHCSRN